MSVTPNICDHCGQFLHQDEAGKPDLCEYCAKPEAIEAWEAEHAKPEPEEPKAKKPSGK